MKMTIFATSLLVSIHLLAASPVQLDLGQMVERQKDLIKTQLTASNCEAVLKPVNDFYEALEPAFVDVQKAKSEAGSIIRNMFLSRVQLKDSLNKMTLAGRVSESCIRQIRRNIRVSRFVEEYLAKVAGFDGDVDVLAGDSPNILVNPEFKDLQLRSGDILISRGNAIVSAAIARIGQEDGHFSHAAIAYIDENTKVTYMVEAHIEIGLDVAPIDKAYLHDGKVRVAVYRPKDEKLAHAAAKYAYDFANAAIKNGERVPYDFGMDIKTEKNIFCSEVPYMAYKHASQGQFVLGKDYHTSFDTRRNTFLQGIGITVGDTYAPSDIELDTNLDFVGEWRDFSRVHLTHRKDAILMKIYDWMEKEGYRLETSQMLLKAHLAHFIRHMPLLGKQLEDKVALNITPRVMKNMMTMDFAGDKMLDDLIAEYDSYLKKTGLPMTLPVMLRTLDGIRQQDLERAQALQTWKEQSLSFETTGDIGKPEEPHFVQYFTK